MIGLAISMSATSLLFVNHNKPAIAAGPLTQDLTTGLDNTPHQQSSEVKLLTLALKHEVKKGETLWDIAQKYNINPQEIADLNHISPETSLLAGQSLKIPPTSLNSFNKTPTQEWQYSLDNLRSSRQRLQESLIALRSTTEEQASETVIITEEVASTNSAEIAPTVEKQSENVEIPLTVEPVPTTEEYSTKPSQTWENAHSRANLGQEILPVPLREPQTVREPKVIIPEEKTLYRVQPGDTLNNIARRHRISPQALAKANHIDDLNLIKVDQDLVIPKQQGLTSAEPLVPPNLSNPSTLVVRVDKNESVSRVESLPIPVSSPVAASSQKLREEVSHLQQTHQQLSPLPTRVEKQNLTQQPRNPEWVNPRTPKPEQIVGSALVNVENYNESFRIPVGATVEPEIPGLPNPNQHLPETLPLYGGYIWPAKGVLTSGYGRRWGRMHRGIDIAGPIGTPIVAAADGEVIAAGWNSGGYGNLVKVKHQDGNVTLYAHNHRILVRRGERVSQGQQLAEMGSTGFSTGPHLHFELHPQGGKAVNPIAYLPRSRN
jgi:murein DD-endopeptidase MepM/ murein hydrolase activator NlpD